MVTSGVIYPYLQPIHVRRQTRECEFRNARRSPYSAAILANPSQGVPFGKSNTFPIIGYPFGPGGYGERLGPRCLSSRARIIAATTTAKAEPTNFSGNGMVGGCEPGDGSEGPGLLLLSLPDSMGSLHSCHAERNVALVNRNIPSYKIKNLSSAGDFGGQLRVSVQLNCPRLAEMPNSIAPATRPLGRIRT